MISPLISPFAGCGNHVRVQPSDGDKAAKITPLIVWFVVFISPIFVGRPAFQIACAVDCAEAFRSARKQSPMSVGLEGLGKHRQPIDREM